MASTPGASISWSSSTSGPCSAGCDVSAWIAWSTLIPYSMLKVTTRISGRGEGATP